MCTYVTINGKSAGFQRSHLCQFVVLLHSSRTTGGVKYIEINNIPQITLANKRIKSILVTILEGDLLCLHFDLFLLLFVGLTKKRGGYMKCVFVLGTMRIQLGFLPRDSPTVSKVTVLHQAVPPILKNIWRYDVVKSRQ